MIKNKVNDIKINPVITAPEGTKKTVRGYNMFKEPYANIALIAKKKSGKSTVIYNCLEKCATKGTNIMIFCPTVLFDDTYKKMIKMLNDKGCNVITFDHFLTDTGDNIITNTLDELKKQKEEEERLEQEKKNNKSKPKRSFIIKFDNTDSDNEDEINIKKKKKNKLVTPELIIVADDLSSDLHNKGITSLLTKNRHYKTKVFLSIHNVTNIEPSALRMIDNLILFKHINDDKLNEITEKMDISHHTDTKYNKRFNNIYRDATEGDYNFMHYDRNNDEYYKNFDEKYN